MHKDDQVLLNDEFDINKMMVLNQCSECRAACARVSLIRKQTVNVLWIEKHAHGNEVHMH